MSTPPTRPASEAVGYDPDVTGPHWSGHILPDGSAQPGPDGHLPPGQAAVVDAPPVMPPPPAPAPIYDVAAIPVNQAVARGNLGSSNPLGAATDLAARVPQLMEQGLRGRSRVRSRKVRRVVRHIDPWSVLTFSVLFHLCVFAAFLLASVLVWNAADAAGTIENIESFIRELGDYQTYEINGDVVFRAAMAIAGILTLASSIMVVLLTVVFNLISDLVGGIRVTVVEEEAVRVRRN